MDSTPSFEQTLESDMRSLAAEVNRTQQMEGVKNMEGLDALKEAIKAFPRLEQSGGAGAGAQANAAGVPIPPSVHDNAASPLPAYAQNAAPEVKLEIEYLLDVALHKGVSAALSESEKSPYFVQDTFHDALAGRLYPELQKRGLVK